MKCDTIVVPETRSDECNGCFVKPECVIIQEDNSLFDIKVGDSLSDLILSMTNKISLLEVRVKQLEDLQNV